MLRSFKRYGRFKFKTKDRKIAKYTHKEFRKMLAKKVQEYSKEYKVKFYTANQSVEKHWCGLLKSFVIDF
ncbi:hypothetical protein VN0948_02440 [Helicobacter pylori]